MQQPHSKINIAPCTIAHINIVNIETVSKLVNGEKYKIANVTKITFDVELISVAHAGHVDAVALDQLHCVLVPKHLIIIMIRMAMTMTMAMTLMIKLAIKLKLAMKLTMIMAMTMAMIMILLSVLVQQNLVG